MARQKRIRFAALERMANVVDGRRCSPGWFEAIFGPHQPVVLELGCGRGEYTLALARHRPQCRVLGVDRNGARLWKGAARALEDGLTNAMFLRSAVEHLDVHIPARRVSEIWLPFPDPLPKSRQAKHRLTAPGFLERYRRLLRTGGAVYLKTDDLDLLRSAEQAVRVVGGRVLGHTDAMGTTVETLTTVETTFERRFRHEGRPIYDRVFCLDHGEAEEGR